MTKNRHPITDRRGVVASNSLHERYVRAVNSALQDGRESVARELAAAYADDLRVAEHRGQR
jgi:hypothetical protein